MEKLTKQGIIEVFAKAKDNDKELRDAIKNIVNEIGEEDLSLLRDFIMYDLEIEV